MKRMVLAAALLVCGIGCGAAAQAPQNTLSDKEKAAGWKLLFDGKSLSGWEATQGRDQWSVQDGAIACTGKSHGYLYTTEQYGDFALKTDFKFDKGANSGIFLRLSDLKDPVNTGIEIQVYDTYGKDPDKHSVGAIYDLIAPSKNVARPAGEWNTALVRCAGPMLSVELNGEKIAAMNLDQWTTAGMNPDGTKNKFRYALKDFARKGHVALQDHGAPVWYRNVKLRPLAAKG